jgi:hypothetical protein
MPDVPTVWSAMRLHLSNVTRARAPRKVAAKIRPAPVAGAAQDKVHGAGNARPTAENGHT